VIALLSHEGLMAQSPEQTFEKANGLYQEAKFAEAIRLYESIVRNGYVSGELYYDLGNAYYKAGDIGRAVLNYERALRLMPNDEDLQHNLQLANFLVTDRIEPTPRLFVWDYWDSLKAAFSLDALTWTGYAMYVLLITSLALVIISRTYRLRRLALFAGSISTVLLVLVIVLLAGRIGDATRMDQAVVIAKITTVKNSPDAQSSDAFVLHSGVKVTITDSVGEWIKIRLADGKVGWMEWGDAEVVS
jgi:tetratricopeptide (TPR) repeat protein